MSSATVTKATKKETISAPTAMGFTPQTKAKLEKMANTLKECDLETITDQAQFCKELTKNLSADELNLFLVIYGGQKWDQGYTQGKDDPDFLNTPDDEEDAG